MNVQEQFAQYKRRLEAYLDALPMTGAPERIREAMRYSLLS